MAKTKNVKNAGYKASDYKKMSQYEHLMNRSDMYIGSSEFSKREVYTFDKDFNKIIKDNITMPYAVIHLFKEIISNAADGIQRSINNNYEGFSNPAITVEMDRKTIRITNTGLPIPVEFNQQEQLYTPEFILGNLLTSQSYGNEDNNNTISTYGVGAKATNCFSSMFSVDIGDNFNKKRYIQTWTNNMLNKTEPNIIDYQGTNYVSITFMLDFAKFKMTEYPDEAFNLYAKMCADYAFTCKKAVSFNGKVFDNKYINEYAKLFSFTNEENINNCVIYHKYDDGVETVKKAGTDYSKDENAVANAEIIILDTPNNGDVISYVNGINMTNHGVHVDAAMVIFSDILEDINKKLNNNTDDKTKITVKNIKKHITTIVNFRVFNAKFDDGNKKSKLTGPKPKFEFDKKLLTKINKWKAIDAIYDSLKSKNQALLKNKRGKKLTFDIKVIDANYAGKKNCQECSLFYVEGDSASFYCTKYRDLLGNRGADYYGVFVGSGVPLNTRNIKRENISKIFNNKTLVNLFKVLGLEYDVDYSIAENRKKLRYGKVIIATDEDSDGKHIASIIISNLEHEFPTLLNIKNFISFIRTRYVTVGKEIFYSKEDYEYWLSLDENNKYKKTKYYKGLGKNQDEEIEYDIKNPKIVDLNYDDNAHSYLELGLNDKYINERKQWILSHTSVLGLTKLANMNISDYIKYELIKHPIANINRCIPRALDGLKEVQRKIIFASSKKFKYGKGAKNQSLKISQFAGFIAEKMAYHYGDASLNNSIICMVQNFIGSNNLSVFVADGQFGSRNKLGEKNNSASPRYISTYLNNIFRYIYREEDKNILQLQDIEGTIAEPITMLPVIPPMYNGCNGIATGWSTRLPNYNVYELCYWLMAKLSAKETNIIMPWYRNYKGILIVEDREYLKKLNAKNNNKKDATKVDKTNDDAVDEGDATDVDEVEGDEFAINEDKINIDKDTKYTLRTQGTFYVDESENVHVTELPIGLGAFKYERFLDSLIKDEVITDYKVYNNFAKGNDIIHYIIYGMKNPTDIKLKLIKKIGLSNFMLLDLNNKLIKFNTIYDYLEYYYAYRLEYYKIRKTYILKEYLDKIEIVKQKIKFLELYTNKTLTTETSKPTLLEIIKNHGIVWDNVKELKASKFNKDGIDKLNNELNEITKKYNDIENTSVECIWFNEINEFLVEYEKMYPELHKPVFYPISLYKEGYGLYRRGDSDIKFIQPVIKQDKVKDEVLKEDVKE